MKKPLLVLTLLAAATVSQAVDTAYSPVQGGMTITIAAGTGTTRTITAFSLPLWMNANLTGASSGRVSSITSSAITDSAANWTAGEISNAAVPCFLQITSGAAAGRAFLISSVTANTSTTLTIDSAESVDLTTLGITAGASGDTYRIFAADTLSVLLPGTSGVLGGTSAATSDNVLLNIGGIWRTFFFSTTNNRWTQVAFGSPNASNTIVGPNAAVQFSRLAATPLTLTIAGAVPTMSRQVSVANNGVTFLATGWPVATTLSAAGFQNISGWRKSSVVASADTVQLLLSGIWKKFYHDGTNWRQVAFGSPIADSQTIAPGTAYLINRGAGSGVAIHSETVPYSL